jgi:hypothetical protein
MMVTACVALTFAWLLAIRAGTPLLQLPPVLAWIGVLFTVGWPLSRHLWRVRGDDFGRAAQADLRFPDAGRQGAS